MELDKRIAALEARIDDMARELERVSAENDGFKFAFIQLAAFLPLTERDVTAAREFALAQAEDATLLGDTPSEVTKTVFSTIHRTMALAGVIWRQRRDDVAGKYSQ